MDTLIHTGGEVKALGDGRFRAPLVIFGREAKDLDGDYFTPETDLWQDFSAPVAVPFLYAHGLDPELKHTKLGGGKVSLSRDEAAVWMEGQLDIADRYESKIYEMIEAGKIGTSSGSIAHLVTRKAEGKAYELKSWPIAEASLTPKPCNPLNRVVAVKDFQSLDIPEFKDVMSTGDGYAPQNNRSDGKVAAPPPFHTATGAGNPGNDKAPARDSGSVECPKCHLHCHFDADHKECPYCGQTLSLSAEGTPLAGKTFSDELDAALAAVKSCTTRAGEIHRVRSEMKEGRTISQGNRQKLQEIHSLLAQFLEASDPTTPPAPVSLESLETQFALSEARRKLVLLGL